MPSIIANATIADASYLGSIDNEASWPTMVWALLPIAFNSMTQPAGSIARGVTAEQSFYLRVSPILCAVDALAVLSQFTHLAIKFRNPRFALSCVSRAKFQNSSDAGSTRNQLQTLQENDVFRVILFMFGVLPQILKLYACKGIPGSQALASLYIAYWLVLELLVIIPTRHGFLDSSEARSSEEQTYINITTFLIPPICYVQILFLDIMALYLLLPTLYKVQELQQPSPSLPKHLAAIIIYGCCYFFLYLLRPIAPFEHHYKWVIEAVDIVYYALVLYVVTDERVASKAEAVWLGSLKLGHFFSMVGLTGHGNAESFFTKYPWPGSIPFFFMQVVTAVGYYGIKYDPTGTSKPAWTGYLG
ncbi:MAG: hypothetical protein Q9225_007898 [Loekoesia sp. 1 TL-2023]